MSTVLRQWAFLTYESTGSLDAAIERFFEARSALNSWRQSTPRDVWLRETSPAYLEYKSSILRVQGASYFVISADRQVVRILDADPGLSRLPGELHDQVHQMRNVIQHWDEWTKDELRRGRLTSAARLRDVDPEPWPFGFKFTTEMDFLVGGIISLSQMRDVFAALWRWRATSSST